ncbi:DNA mismatch repair protein MutS [Methanococcoides alaskense]|uniref:DNA mismatch repair protein MutS n=1 Tax=Methanococcoides alaskense TaxID=325778 RepID=A0AA90U0P1_9EURY|nr:DNA mismatch repair protein MutS [Methanococcoides alaskense]MDA0524760.1 DNA mismatch repair protein MutS [Methanococcoides alaskense]MDR6223119.1 DNA mismatch repair protein MutS [Methanococcoides alaskense]
MIKLTPAMKQYYDAKKQHSDALIFFRMGDFYESFGEDAKTIAKELEITLTTRGKDIEGEKMPLAGIPYHALDNYLPRLVKKGYKVAICEQLEDPKKAKGIIKRGVVRVVTPGTAIDTSMFTDPSNNYLMSISGGDGDYGVSFLDVSTGEFLTTQFADTPPYDRIASEAARMRPSECIISRTMFSDERLVERLKELNVLVHEFKDEAFEIDSSRKLLERHFNVSTLEGMGCVGLPYAISSAGAALDYALSTQMRELGHVNELSTYSDSEFMMLDSITLRNLEIVKNVRGEGNDTSILKVLDDTNTPMGGRLLQKWLLKPLINVDSIDHRLDALECLANDTMLRFDVRSHLSFVKDVERLIGRVVYGNSNARDLIALKKSLGSVPQILESMGDDPGCEMLRNIRDGLLKFDQLENIVKLIDDAIVDEPPVSVREGGMIRSGYNEKLDELKGMSTGGKTWIASFQKKERDRTGIKSLKVGYNRVFGYYIEITKSNIAQIPDDYIRKQTMRNAERFYTPELKEWEGVILSADEKITALENELFTEITSRIASHASDLQRVAVLIGQLDCTASLAEVAVNNNFVRPNITSDCKILIREGRHPVVEKTVRGGFVPNDTEMDCVDEQFLLITGPNMAGKSTYMRQVSLIVIMAQAGSFVPASHASIGIVDRVFTRVGAFDDLASGQSTFMVEMVELANILNNATPKSLVLLDEIGRGTSTYDGYSIAKAVVEYIHNKGRVGVRSLFATHYHQLTNISSSLKRVKNYHIAVKEDGDDLVFLRKIVPGATDKSYGIHVARLAGVPHKVTQRAKEVLQDIEDESAISKESDSKRSRKKKSAQYTQLMLFDPEGSSAPVAEPDPVVEELKELDVNSMTPIEALNKLSELQKKAGKGGK